MDTRNEFWPNLVLPETTSSLNWRTSQAADCWKMFYVSVFGRKCCNYVLEWFGKLTIVWGEWPTSKGVIVDDVCLVRVCMGGWMGERVTGRVTDDGSSNLWINTNRLNGCTYI